MPKKWFFYAFFSFTSLQLFSQDINRYNDRNQREGYWVFYHDSPKNTLIKLTGRFENGREIDTFKYYIPKISHPMSIRIYSPNVTSCYVLFYDKDRQLIAEGTYDTDRKKQGKWCYYDKAKNLSALEYYDHGKKDKVAFVFFDDGKMVEYQTYEKGYKNGPYERFNDKGDRIEKLNFFENTRHGEAIFYDLNGYISIKGSYNHGIKDKIWTYYKQGQVSRTEDYTPQGRKRKKLQAKLRRKKKKEKMSQANNASDTTGVSDWIDALDKM